MNFRQFTQGDKLECALSGLEMYHFYGKEHTYPLWYLVLNGYFDTRPFRWWTDREVETTDFALVDMENKWRRNNHKMGHHEARRHYLPSIPSVRCDGNLDKDAIKAQHSISDIVSSYGIKLTKMGNRMKGNCPMHNDVNASLCLYLDQNRWWCYGESCGGDIIDWVMKMEGVSFREALEILK